MKENRVSLFKKMFALSMGGFLLLTSGPKPVLGAQTPSIGAQEEPGIWIEMEDVLSWGAESVSKTVEEVEVIEKSWKETLAPFLEGSKLLYSDISMLAGTAQGIYNILKLTGVVEDPEEKRMEDLVTGVKSIEEKVGDIDRKLNQLADTIDKNFAKLEVQNRLNDYKNNQKNWTDFYAEKIANHYFWIVTTLNDGVSRRFCEYAKNWQQLKSSTNKMSAKASDLRVLYTKTDLGYVNAYSSLNLDEIGNNLPNMPKYSDDEYLIERYITLPSSYISAAMSDQVIKNESYEQILLEAFEQGVYHAAEEKNLGAYDGFYTEWNTLPPEDKKETAARIAKDLFDALSYEIMYQTVNQDQFVSTAKTYYNEFTACMEGENQVIMPLHSRMGMLSSVHAFEKEIRDEALTMYGYLGMLTIRYGLLMSNILQFAEGQSQADVTSVLDAATDIVNLIHREKEAFITGEDNYCYITNSKLEYRTASYSSSMKAYIRYRYEGDFGENVFDSYLFKQVTFGNVKFFEENVYYSNWELKDTSGQMESGVLKAQMIPVNQLQLLVQMYQIDRAGSDSFVDYLIENGVVLKEDQEIAREQLIMTAPGVSTPILNDDHILMQVTNLGDSHEDFQGVSFLYYNDRSNSKIKINNIRYKDKIMGTVLNPKTLSIQSNSVLAAKAYYIDASWRYLHDEAAFYTSDGVKLNDNWTIVKSGSTTIINGQNVIPSYESFVTILAKPSVEYGVLVNPVVSQSEMVPPDNLLSSRENLTFSDVIKHVALATRKLHAVIYRPVEQQIGQWVDAMERAILIQ